MYYAVLFLLLTTNYGLCSEHDSPLFEAARLLMQNAGSKEAGDIGGLASSLIKGLDPSLLAGMLEQVSGNDGNENSNDGGGSGPLDLIASLAPLLLQQQGHKHSEDPSLEDVEVIYHKSYINDLQLVAHPFFLQISTLLIFICY